MENVTKNKQITYGKAVALRCSEIIDTKAKGISVNKLSELSLIPQSTLNDLIHEKSEFPSMKGIIEFCRYFNMSLAEFYESPYFYIEFLPIKY